MKPIRVLRADEIECRVGTVTKKGVTLLLYKDARCDMAILDELFTPFGWERKHELINGKEFCTVSVKGDTGEWVSKQDCGTESYTEKQKGESSDAFKRACVCWGIGRELYTKTFLFVCTETVCVDKTRNKYEMKDKYQKFHVHSIDIDEVARKILNVEIADKNGKIVCKWNNDNLPIYDDNEDEKPTITREDDRPIMCTSCGKEIKPCKNKEGVVITPSNVIANTNGLCMACYKTSAGTEHEYIGG